MYNYLYNMGINGFVS